MLLFRLELFWTAFVLTYFILIIIIIITFKKLKKSSKSKKKTFYSADMMDVVTVGGHTRSLAPRLAFSSESRHVTLEGHNTTLRCFFYGKYASRQRTEVCRYKWHSAGSLGSPFPVLNYKYIVRVKYTEGIFSNVTRKPLRFEVTKRDCSLIKKINFIVSFVIISGTISFPIAVFMAVLSRWTCSICDILSCLFLSLSLSFLIISSTPVHRLRHHHRRFRVA